jgi:hypothetical protein
MLNSLRFSLQNAVGFITLTFLDPVLFTFYIQDELNLNVKLRCQKVKIVLKIEPVGFLRFDVHKSLHRDTTIKITNTMH